MSKTTKHIGDLVVSNNNLDYCRALKEVSGYVYINADNASLPLLEKSGYVDIGADNASLPLLKEVSGYVYINADNASLPLLGKSGYVYINADNASLPLLEKSGYVYIGADNASLPLLGKSGSIDIRGDNASLPLLKEVSGSIDIRADNASLPLLEKSGSIDIRADNASLPLLEKSGSIDIRADNASLPLLEKSGSIDINADNASLPLLEKSGYVDVQNNVNIRGLTGIHTIRGQSLDLRYVDGFTMIIDSEVQRGDFTISKARYFGGGDLDKLKKCFLAKRGDVYAHGATAKEAVSDVNFKFLQQDFDTTKLVAEINKRKTVSVVDYRLLTGACLAGVHSFLASKNIDFQQQETLPLTEVLKLTKGAFGGDRMAELFGGSE